MPDSDTSLRDLLFEEPGVGRFLTAIVERAPSVYGNAHSRSFAEKAYDKPEAVYTFGHNRRGGMEAMFRREARIAGLLAETEYTERTNTPYVLVRAGRFFLTESHVRGKGEIPPTADFRKQHAAVNALLLKGSLPFPEFDALKLYELSKANGIYGIVSHGSPLDDAKSPGFIRLVFPSENCEQLVENICLFEFRNEFLAKQKAIAHTEIAVDRAQPTLKKKSEDK